ncbi:ESX-1 secretion-associated protein [Amycolatopsis sp. NPDC004378]
MPDGAGGYQVEVDALHKYVGDLGEYKDQGARITEQVGRSNVGDKSWGVVGIFTKGGYDDALRELQTLLSSLADGLATAQAKLTDAANVYQGIEDDHTTFFGQVEVLLDGPGKH